MRRVVYCLLVPSSRKSSRSRSEEHTSELQSRLHLVCRLLLEKKHVCVEVGRQSAHVAPLNHFLFVFIHEIVGNLVFFNDTATTEIYTLSLHDALPISRTSASARRAGGTCRAARTRCCRAPRSEEHTSELQSRLHLVCRLLLEKKK